MIHLGLAELASSALRHGARARRLRRDPRRVSVAIPTFNRAGRVLSLVPRLLRDARIGEIVVRDDASAPADAARLQAGLAPFAPRVRLARGARNLGAFGNKLAAVADCRNEWAVLLDSDNRIGPDYLDAFFALPAWSARAVYSPPRARPRFDFRFLAGAVLDLDAAGGLVAGARADALSVFLNTGNYVVPVRAYVERLTPYADRRPAGADVFFANLAWLRGGGLLVVVPGMDYDHDVHEGSWFLETAAESKALIRAMRDALASRDPARVDAVLRDAARAPAAGPEAAP